eukprot:COSAG01_NODE_61015_length_291_cov_1.338542_1_plen_30_part_01
MFYCPFEKINSSVTANTHRLSTFDPRLPGL